VWRVPLVEGIGILLAAGFLVWNMVRIFGNPGCRINKRESLNLFINALPVGASEIIWAFRVYFPTLFLGFLLIGARLGWFTSAHRILVASHAFIWLYFYNLLPSISRTVGEPTDVYQRLMRISLTMTTWLGVLIGIAGTFFALPIVKIVFGDQYDPAFEVLQILIWFIPLAFLSGHFRNSLIAYNYQRHEFISEIVSFLCVVVLNLALVPRFGTRGSAAALVLSEVIVVLVLIYFCGRDITTLPIISYIWRPVLTGALVMAGMFLVSPLNTWLTGLTGLAVFAAGFFILQPHAFSELNTYLRLGRPSE
jgi:O-antigen/teichoic acid export membrane protein